MKIQVFDDKGKLITTVVGCVNPQQEFDQYYKKMYDAAYWREYIEPEPPGPTMDEVKSTRSDEIKAERDRREMLPFEYMGKKIDFDDKAKDRLDWAINTARSYSSFTVEWTCYDNSKLLMTATDLLGIPLVIAQRSYALHQTQRQVRDQIEQATTIEEVDTIVANIAWPT